MASGVYTWEYGRCTRSRSSLRSSYRPFFQGTIQDVAEVSIFIGTWTTVTTLSGMRDVDKMAQRFRTKGAAVKKRIDMLTEVSSITEGK